MPYRSFTSNRKDPGMSILPKVRPMIRLVKLFTFLPFFAAVWVTWAVLVIPFHLGTLLLGYLIYRNPVALMKRTGTGTSYDPHNYIFPPWSWEYDNGFYYTVASPLHWSRPAKLWPWFWDLGEETDDNK